MKRRVKMPDIIEEIQQKNRVSDPARDVEIRAALKDSIYATCIFDGTTTGINRIPRGKGIRWVNRTATGTYTLVFDVPLRTDDYVVIATPSTRTNQLATTSKAKESFVIQSGNNSGTLTDDGEINVIVINI